MLAERKVVMEEAEKEKADPIHRAHSFPALISPGSRPDLAVISPSPCPHTVTHHVKVFPRYPTLAWQESSMLTERERLQTEMRPLPASPAMG